MIRATTPTHTFTFPMEYVGHLSKILITYSQNDKILLNKTQDDGTWEGNKFFITLTQEETNLFDSSVFGKVQVRAITDQNIALATFIDEFVVNDVLNDEVL